MKILVSACLLGENCKYDGGNNKNERLVKFLEKHEVVSVCPEKLGGLPVPRIPCEIVEGSVYNKNGVSCDKEFRDGAGIALSKAVEHNVDLAILQSRSPSCGVKQVYDGNFNRTLKSGAGIFASMLMEKGIKVMDVEDFDEAAVEKV